MASNRPGHCPKQPASRWLCLGARWIVPAVAVCWMAFGAPVRAQDAAVDPAVAAAYNEGLTAASAGDFATAKTKFQEAVAQAPDFVDAHYNLGLVLQNLGDFAGARAEFERTLELDPSNVAAPRLLADTLVKLGDFAAALPAYEKAIAADSTRFELYYAAADAAAQVYTKPEELGKLVEAYRAALRKDPSNPLAFQAAIGLASAGSKMKDNEIALEGYQRAVKAKPDSPTAHYNYAVILQKMKRSKEAVEQLESAIALKEPYGQAHYVLAGIYYNDLNQTEKALAHYEKAAADPEFDKADKAKQSADMIRDYLEKKAAADATKKG